MESTAAGVDFRRPVAASDPSVSSPPTHVPLTHWLAEWRAGDGRAFDAVIEASLAELQRIAASRLRQAGPMTIDAREVLNEAVARLLDAPPELRNRSHFLATMSLLMRAVVVDHARARVADKRGGEATRITYTDALAGEEHDAFDVLALDQALARLAEHEPRCSDVLHLTYFAGLEQARIGEVLGVSLRTVERDLRFARAWLHDVMQDSAGHA